MVSAFTTLSKADFSAYGSLGFSLNADKINQCNVPKAETCLSKRERHAQFRLEAMSRSLPFWSAPKPLDGSLAGDVGFDPLHLSEIPFDFSQLVVPPQWEGEDPSSREGVSTLYWMREAELKHGRICMLAVVGYLAVDAGLRFDSPVFAEVADSLVAHDIMVDRGVMGVMLCGVSLIELLSGVAIYEASLGSGREPGDFGLDPLSLVKGDAERKYDFQAKEIKHARLAMLAFSGLVTQAALIGKSGFPYM